MDKRVFLQKIRAIFIYLGFVCLVTSAIMIIRVFSQLRPKTVQAFHIPAEANHRVLFLCSYDPLYFTYEAQRKGLEKVLYPRGIEYDVIFIGSPNWFNTMVPVVHTFADAYDFAGKKVAPFCTHGTKGAYKVVADIAQAAKNAEIIPGFGAYSQTMDEKTQVEVKLWLTGNGLIKPEN